MRRDAGRDPGVHQRSGPLAKLILFILSIDVKSSSCYASLEKLNIDGQDKQDDSQLL
jgi:hypothetical protein